MTKPKLPHERKKTGRPLVYNQTFAAQAEKLCRFGATDVELAQFFDVSLASIMKWKVRYPEFLQSLKVGKEAADERVVRSLYHRAMGYTYDSTKIFMPAGREEPVYAPYREHVPPDTVAAIFWLKNRRPDLWRDRQEHDHSGTIIHAGISAAEKFALVQAKAESMGMKLLPPPSEDDDDVEVEGIANRTGE